MRLSLAKQSEAGSIGSSAALYKWGQTTYTQSQPLLAAHMSVYALWSTRTGRAAKLFHSHWYYRYAYLQAGAPSGGIFNPSLYPSPCTYCAMVLYPACLRKCLHILAKPKHNTIKRVLLLLDIAVSTCAKVAHRANVASISDPYFCALDDDPYLGAAAKHGWSQRTNWLAGPNVLSAEVLPTHSNQLLVSERAHYDGPRLTDLWEGLPSPRAYAMISDDGGAV